MNPRGAGGLGHGGVCCLIAATGLPGFGDGHPPAVRRIEWLRFSFVQPLHYMAFR